VESRIAVPIEVEMLGIPKTKILRSVTKYGLVDVTIDFQDGTDIYWARQQVSERLGNLTDSLPSGISGGMAPSLRRWVRCSCSPSIARPCRWSSAVACWIGSFDLHCARCLASLMSTRWVASSYV
jgi:hypothetical protein